jgi:hypothetical protein
MQIKFYKITVFLISLSILISACSNKPFDYKFEEGLWLPSLDEVYPMLEDEALEIDFDVKLQSVWISLFPDDDNITHAIQASFSKELGGEIILIHYFIDGTITKEVANPNDYLNLPPLENNQLPGIDFDEKIISVPDAFSTLIEYADIDSSYTDKMGCSKLILDKYLNPEFDKVIWKLVLRDCEGNIFRDIEMDAYTRELYSFE